MQDKKYTYKEALDIVKEALKPLGDTYIKDLNKEITNVRKNMPEKLKIQ